MSVIVGVVKNGKGILASDSLYTAGSLKCPPERKVNHQKIYQVGTSYLGTVGWAAIDDVIESLVRNHLDKIDFSSRPEIFDTMLKLQPILKNDYFFETSEDDSDQPVESNHIWGLILNENGLFTITSYRNINEYDGYWSIGSGKEFALGSLNSTYDILEDSLEIATRAIKAATDFDDGCALPIQYKEVNMAL